jgi:hypothetical protein
MEVDKYQVPLIRLSAHTREGYSSNLTEKGKARGAIKPWSGELCESSIANHREQRTHVFHLLV